MDLKNWKKIKEDAKSATMEHPEGHLMVIAIKALPKIQAEQIRRLKLVGKEKDEPKRMSKGGTIQKFADKGAVEESDPDIQKEIDAADEAEESAKSKESQQNVAPVAQPLDLVSIPENKNAAVPTPPTPDFQPTSGPGRYEQEAQKVGEAVLQEQQASNTKQLIDTQRANSMNSALGTMADVDQKRAQAYQANANMFKDQTNKFAQDIANGNIDENKFWHDQRTGSKVANALGLFLGGLSTSFGGHNYAADYIKDQIDRNIAAQKQNLIENPKSILGAYQDLFKNNELAINATRQAYTDYLSHRADQITNQLGSPTAAANNMNLKAQLQLGSNDLLMKSAAIMDMQHSQGQSNNQPNQPHLMAPDDPKWNDKDAKPWTGKIPKTNPLQPIEINMDALRRSQMLGAQNVPGNILPNEGGAVNDAINSINLVNNAQQEIHKQFGEMYKNASPGNDALKYIGSQHLWGLHLPDVSNWANESKRYLTSAASVKKIIANSVKGGGSEELYNMIENELPNYIDTPADYRRKLENIDNILKQQALSAAAPLVKVRGIVKGLP
jgi:hypothetical protein